MQHTDTDYLIIGQGICGTLLSHYLLQAGRSVLVVDAPPAPTASRIASGIMNPVTGKKWVTTWLAQELLPAARDAYRELELLLDTPLIRELELLAFHPTQEAQQLFEDRAAVDDTWLYTTYRERPWKALFNIPFGIGAVSPCYLVDVAGLLDRWRAHLRRQGALLEATFGWTDVVLTDAGVQYRDIRARKIICCCGAADISNPYFTRLPFQLNKGEALIAAIPGLPPTHLYKQGVLSIVPWQEDLFWIGSTFDRDYTDEQPTAAFRRMATAALDRWLQLPYAVKDHLAALRPATGGQKPFAGFHPVYHNVGIFNGMGSKGCSQAPYFAKQLAAHILQGTPIHPEASVDRFVRLLSRP